MNDPIENAARSAMDRAEQEILAARELYKELVQRAEIALNAVRNARLEPGTEPTSTVQPGQYQGMRPIDALESYLAVRKGVQIPLTSVVNDLVKAGVDAGTRKGQNYATKVAHRLKISLASKGKTIGWDPPGALKGVPTETIKVWLISEPNMEPLPTEEKKRKKA